MGAVEEATLASDPLAGTAYRTIRPLGRGGMGDVVEALHVHLDRRVCVKLLRKEHTSDARSVDRLRLEAQVLLALDGHPHVLPARDVERTEDGRVFLVTDLLEGHTVQGEIIRRGRIPLREVIELTSELASGLAAAHRLGVVHRDIKPANLFLTTSPHPRAPGRARRLVVLDFGLAKTDAGPASTPSRVRPLQDPTTEGRILGTPRFISPEQALGKPVDPRTDVYASALVVYTMLVGHGPFEEARGMVEILRAHIDDVPDPPSRHAPGIPREVDAVILRALAKRPADRFAGIEDFAQALARAGRAVEPPTEILARARGPQRSSADAPTEVVDLEAARSPPPGSARQPDPLPPASAPEEPTTKVLADERTGWMRGLGPVALLGAAIALAGLVALWLLAASR